MEPNFFTLTALLGEDEPSLTHIFADGLKPPTRLVYQRVIHPSRQRCFFAFFRRTPWAERMWKSISRSKMESGAHLARPFKREDDLMKILLISKMDIYELISDISFN